MAKSVKYHFWDQFKLVVVVALMATFAEVFMGGRYEANNEGARCLRYFKRSMNVSDEAMRLVRQEASCANMCSAMKLTHDAYVLKRRSASCFENIGRNDLADGVYDIIDSQSASKQKDEYELYELCGCRLE